MYLWVKIKVTLLQALRLCTVRTAHRGIRGIAYSFMTTALEGGEGTASRPGRSLSPGKNGYPLYRRLGGPQGRSGQVRKISPHRDSIPGPSSTSPVAIPTTLPGPQYLYWDILNYFYQVKPFVMYINQLHSFNSPLTICVSNIARISIPQIPYLKVQ